MEKSLYREIEIQKNTHGNNGNTESKFNDKAAQLKNRFIQNS